jgi:Xaa-Pro aminopeptidase
MFPTLQIQPDEFQSRATRLAEYLKSQQLASIVLFDNFHITYFSGFAFIPTERPIVFAVSPVGERILLVPRLEYEHAKAEAQVDRIESYAEYPGKPHPMDQFKSILEGIGFAERGKIGADSDGYPWILGYQGPSLSSLTGAQVVLVGSFVAHLMAIKSPAELALIRESVKWANLAHRLLQKYTCVGANEVEVSMRASNQARLALIDTLGVLYRSQDPFTDGPEAGYRGQIGRNAAIPHSLTTNATFLPGDVLVTGAGCPMWGYNSELERTMVIGEPSAEQDKYFGHMKEVQEVAFEALRPGTKCSDVDRAVSAYFEKNGLTPYWRHHSGHSIGLRYHEGPFLDSGDDTVLEPGMVFTVEPGLYVPALGGFRHSDTVVITNSGIEVLTYYPRDLPSLKIPA